VCLARSYAPLTIDCRQHLRATEQLTLRDPHPVHDQALHRALDVDDL
jgi:hypothetical protein